MNTHCSMAVLMPMSRTRLARAANSADSWSGRPNSLISVAPGAENRSVICEPMSALWSAASRCKAASRRPMSRAGTTNTGSSTSASSVTCQEMLSMTARVSVSVTRLPATPDSVSLNARWAPITSLLRRLTSAPVRVRVKNATGMRCTWSKTAVRSDRISPSPSVADSNRVTIPSPASAIAMSAISSASRTTVRVAAPSTMLSTTVPARTGVATPRTAPTTLNARNPRSAPDADERTA
jgi:hypothetical protein